MSDQDDGLKSQFVLAGVIGLALCLYGLRLYLGRPLLPSWRSLGGPAAGSVLEEGERPGTAAPLPAPARVEINGVPAQQSIYVVTDGEPERLQERRATPQGDMRVPGTPQSASNPMLAPKIFERPEIPQDSLALQREKVPEIEREHPIIFFIKNNTEAVIAIVGMLFLLGWIVWAKITARRPELGQYPVNLLALLPAAFVLAAPRAPFPKAFPAMVERSAAAQPFYLTQLSESFADHARTVSALDSSAIRPYLRGAAGVKGGDEGPVTLALESGTLAPGQAAAVLVGAALQAPEEFQSALDGLEEYHGGLGKILADNLRGLSASGAASSMLRRAAERDPQAAGGLYEQHAQLRAIFDRGLLRRGLLADESGPAVPAQEFTGYGPDGRPRPSGLVKGARVDVSR